ncbi:MAG: hypothetical protein HY698_09570 [Deltaproteobacteria bacterium]|nr:hypothetical protein [Deltaproteobacteria bacterium]
MIRGLLWTSAFLGIMACAPRAKETRPTAAERETGRPEMAREHASMCPPIQGVAATAEAVPGGVAMRLAAPPAQVSVVQRHARHMAAMHERRQVAGRAEGEDRAKEHPMPHDMSMAWPDAEVSVLDTEDGARIIFLAENPEDVGELRRKVTEHVAHMRHGGCPMMR